MAVAKFKAERFGRTPESPKNMYKIWLDGHEIGQFVRGFEIIEHMGETSIVKLEVIATAIITEEKPNGSNRSS